MLWRICFNLLLAIATFTALILFFRLNTSKSSISISSSNSSDISLSRVWIEMLQWNSATTEATPTTVRSNSRDENSIISERKQIYKARTKLLRKVCRQRKLSAGTINSAMLSKEILLSLHNHLAYCPIGKTGTSTWMSYLKTMTGVPETFDMHGNGHGYMKHLLRLPSQFTAREKMMVMKDTIKVTFVRHPFVRIVSAFRDKIPKNYNGWKIKSLAYPSNHKVGKWNPNFDQFVGMVLTDKAARYDAHLNFFWRKCDMCHMKYDVIGKAETSADDLKYIFALTGLEDLKAHKKVHKSHHGTSSDDIALELFSTLSYSDVKRLYNLYKIDFQMFDYDPQPFFEVSLKNMSSSDQPHQSSEQKVVLQSVPLVSNGTETVLTQPAVKMVATQKEVKATNSAKKINHQTAKAKQKVA